METALFGAGCFWSIEEYFSKIPGVVKTTVGYSGGKTDNPTYESVCYENTDHAEVIQIEFDSKIISYQLLIAHFWKCHDPTTLDRQGLDIGRQYRSVIFYHSEKQKQIAETSKNNYQNEITRKIVTEIKEANIFYPAEEYHQKYIQKKECSA